MSKEGIAFACSGGADGQTAWHPRTHVWTWQRRIAHYGCSNGAVADLAPGCGSGDPSKSSQDASKGRHPVLCPGASSVGLHLPVWKLLLFLHAQCQLLHTSALLLQVQTHQRWSGTFLTCFFTMACLRTTEFLISLVQCTNTVGVHIAVDSSPLCLISYRTDCDALDSVLCSFPMANISLLKNGRDQVDKL